MSRRDSKAGRLDTLRRCWRDRRAADASCAAWPSSCAPYRWRVLAMFIALVLATARRARARRRWPSSPSTTGSSATTSAALDLVVVAFLVSAVVYGVATYAQTYLVGWVGQRALQDLRLKLFAHLQSLSIGFYSRNRAGVIISRMTNDVEALDQLVEDGLATLIQSSLTLIGVVVILLVLDFHLALLTFLALPILALGGVAFRIASADAYRLTREKIALDHRLPAGDACRGSAWSARSGRSAQHIAAVPPSSTTRTGRPT